MNFSEKLIQLRKKEGISQEELGNRLNVTRQTVSKWELGQTTPELDKLVELSKIFNVSIDELATDSPTNEYQNPIAKNQPTDDLKKKRIIIISIVVIVIALLFWGVSQMQKTKLTNGILDIFKQQNEMPEEIVGTAQDILGVIQNQMNEQLQNNQNQLNNNKEEFLNIYSEVQQEIEEGKNKIEQEINKMEIDRFNADIELYQGTQMGQALRRLFDEVVKNNKTQERKITVKFLNQKLIDANKIVSIKSKIENFKQYEVSFEYDQTGYIYEVNVQKIK